MNDIGEPTVKYGIVGRWIQSPFDPGGRRELKLANGWHFRMRLTNSRRTFWKEFGKAVS
jgi:hypothetical protein